MNKDTIIVLEGAVLADVLGSLSCDFPAPIRTLAIAIDEDGVKFKVNNGVWSPPLGTTLAKKEGT